MCRVGLGTGFRGICCDGTCPRCCRGSGIGASDLDLAILSKRYIVGSSASSPPSPIIIGGLSLKRTANPCRRALRLGGLPESSCMRRADIVSTLSFSPSRSRACGKRGDLLTSIRGTGNGSREGVGKCGRRSEGSVLCRKPSISVLEGGGVDGLVSRLCESGVDGGTAAGFE